MTLNRPRLLQTQQLTYWSGPRREVRAVGVEHRNREPIHPEGNAAGMRRRAGHVLDVPGQAEMVAVIVEAHAGGRLLLGPQGDEQFELQRLLLLADRLHLADAAEEGIAGVVDAERQAEIAGDGLGPDH